MSLKQEGVMTPSPSRHTSLGCPERLFPSEGHETLLGGAEGKAKRTKLTGAMDSKDSVSKLSPIKYLERFKYLAKKNDGNVLDIFNVNNRNLKPRNLSREK